jgi:hypothetical protein
MARASGRDPGEPVELGDDEGVAGAAGGERLAESGPVAAGAGKSMVDVDPARLDAEPGEGVALCGEVLAVGGDPRVADQHGTPVPQVPRPPVHITEPLLRDTD